MAAQIDPLVWQRILQGGGPAPSRPADASSLAAEPAFWVSPEDLDMAEAERIRAEGMRDYPLPGEPGGRSLAGGLTPEEMSATPPTSRGLTPPAGMSPGMPTQGGKGKKGSLPWLDIMLGVGAGVAALKDGAWKEALGGLAGGFFDQKLKARLTEEERSLADKKERATEARKVLDELKDVDREGLKKALTARYGDERIAEEKISRIDEAMGAYAKALADGKIDVKEAEELLVYRGLIANELGTLKGESTQGRALLGKEMDEKAEVEQLSRHLGSEEAAYEALKNAAKGRVPVEFQTRDGRSFWISPERAAILASEMERLNAELAERTARHGANSRDFESAKAQLQSADKELAELLANKSRLQQQYGGTKANPLFDAAMAENAERIKQVQEMRKVLMARMGALNQEKTFSTQGGAGQIATPNGAFTPTQ